jgi:hypothetical protein
MPKKQISIPTGTEMKASDRNVYRWLGAQWGRVERTGRTGRMARKIIGAELTARALVPKKKLSKYKKNKKANAWFKKKVGESAKMFTQKTKLMPGKMYTFGYDAKHKKTLPYWDRFPLIIVLDVYPGGFIGLNFHYLSPIQRERFLRKLLKFATQKGDPENFDHKAMFNVTWDAVKTIDGADKMIHKYLYSQVKTSLLESHPREWENVIYMPYQKFVGASAKSVWSK